MVRAELALCPGMWQTTSDQNQPHVAAAGLRDADCDNGLAADHARQVRSPLTTASATFALKAGVWFRRGRLVMVSPDSRRTACPPSGRNSTSVLCRFPRPALFRRFDYDTLTKRDKINLDILWLKDDSLDDPDLLPPPDEIAAEIVESLEAALDRFRKVTASLSPTSGVE